jgi:tellurite methyltransferase
MGSADADRWNQRYRDARAPQNIDAPGIVHMVIESVRHGARVLDVACGLGDAGLTLAQHGCDVTFVDVSPVALQLVRDRASNERLDVTTMALDLSREDPPNGPWDLITCVHYLDRDLLARLSQYLAPGGRLVAAIATRRNLEQHARPSARFLLEEEELPRLVPALHVLHHDEAWRANGVHEAWLIAAHRDLGHEAA